MVDARHWLPVESFEYGWADAVGCDQLRCDKCRQPVRSHVGDGECRRYQCGCQYVDQHGVDTIDPSAMDDWPVVGRFVPAWSCAGHPELMLPARLDGVLLAEDGDWPGIVRTAILSPPFTPPGVAVDEVWLVRLYRLLGDQPAAGRVGQAVADCLGSRDAGFVRAAFDFFAAEPDAPGGERVATEVGQHADWLATVPDPRDTGVALLHGAGPVLAGRLMVLPRDRVDPVALRVAKVIAFGGVATPALVDQLLRHDPMWTKEHAAHLVRMNSKWLFPLVESARDEGLVGWADTFGEIAGSGAFGYRRLREAIDLVNCGTAVPSSVFAVALSRFGPHEQPARELLSALVWLADSGARRGGGDSTREARGMSREAWLAVATALGGLPGGSGSTYEPADVRWLLREARDLVQALDEEGRTGYLLRDARLASYLRGHNTEPPEPVQHLLAAVLSEASGPPPPAPLLDLVVTEPDWPDLPQGGPAARWRVRWTSSRTSARSRTFACDGDVNAVALGVADGRPVLAVAGGNDPAELRCARTGAVLRRLPADGSPVCAVALGEVDDRPVVATAAHNATVRLWCARTGAVLHVLGLGSHDFPSYVHAVALGEIDGNPVLATGGADRTVRIWDARTGRLVHVLALTGMGASARAVAFGTVDGRAVVAATDDRCVWIWDGHSAEVVRVIADHRHLALGEIDGRPVLVTAGNDDQARIWDVRDATVLRALAPAGSTVRAVAMGAAGGRPVLATAASDGKARLWDARTGELLRVLEGHDGDVAHLLLGEVDGRPVAITTSGSTVRMWDVDPVGDRSVPHAHTAGVTDVAAGVVDGRAVVATVSDDRTARTWDARTGECLSVRAIQYVEGTGVALGRLAGQDVIAVTTGDGALRIAEDPTGWSRWVLESADPAVVAVASGALEGDWVLATARDDRTARLWDGRTDKLLPALAGHDDDLHDVAVGVVDGGLTVATASRDRTVRLWDAGMGTFLRVLAGHAGAVRAVVLGAVDGRTVVATASDDGTARLWDAGTGDCLTVLAAHGAGVTGVALGAVHGRAVVATAGADRTVRFWDARTAARVLEVRLSMDVTAVAAVSGPGFTLADTAGAAVSGSGLALAGTAGAAGSGFALAGTAGVLVLDRG